MADNVNKSPAGVRRVRRMCVGAQRHSRLKSAVTFSYVVAVDAGGESSLLPVLADGLERYGAPVLARVVGLVARGPEQFGNGHAAVAPASKANRAGKITWPSIDSEELGTGRSSRPSPDPAGRHPAL